MLLTNIASWYWDSEEPSDEWELVFDAPMYSNTIDSVNNVSGSLTNSTYCMTSYLGSIDTTNHYLKKDTTGGTVGKCVVYYDMSGKSFVSKMQNASKFKVEYDIYPQYISSTGINQYIFPISFGRSSSSSDFSGWTGLISLTMYSGSSSNGNYIPSYNAWYHITYIYDNDNSTVTYTNGTNTTTASFTGITSSHFNYISLFSKRWSGPNNFQGYFKNLKIYVQ